MNVPGTAIITGAAGGIGRACSIGFARFGCKRLVLVDIVLTGLEETRDLILNEHPLVDILLLNSNLTADGVPGSIVATTVDRFGRIDYLVNVAGTPGGFFQSTDTTTATFDFVQSLNVRATYLLQQATIKQMLKQDPVNDEKGSIVNIGSMVSHVAIPRLSAYVTSKHAVLGLTKADAVGYASSQIRINCVAPGLIVTNLGASIPKEIEDRELNPVLQNTPMGRFGQAEEVANCAVFLASRMASYITGSSLVVDGGYTAR